MKKVYESKEWREKQKENGRNLSENQEWLKKIVESNRKMAKDPNFGKRVSAGLQGIPYEEWVEFKYNESTNKQWGSPEYKKWRIAVFKRDNYTCQICDQHGGNLNGHHIYKVSDYPELIFEVNNGITLCKDCHIHKVNNHKEEYEEEFTKIIIENQIKQ